MLHKIVSLLKTIRVEASSAIAVTPVAATNVVMLFVYEIAGVPKRSVLNKEGALITEDLSVPFSDAIVPYLTEPSVRYLKRG